MSTVRVAAVVGAGSGMEVADVIAFLASDGAGSITGQNIRVDGGITRSV